MKGKGEEMGQEKIRKKMKKQKITWKKKKRLIFFLKYNHPLVAVYLKKKKKLKMRER